MDDAARERTSTVLQRRYATPGGVGVNVAVPVGVATLTVLLRRKETNGSYGVLVTPNWLTTVRVRSKQPDRFVIDFGVAAPANAALDYAVVRSE